MATLENVSVEDLRQNLTEVEDADVTKRLLAGMSINYWLTVSATEQSGLTSGTIRASGTNMIPKTRLPLRRKISSDFAAGRRR